MVYMHIAIYNELLLFMVTYTYKPILNLNSPSDEFDDYFFSLQSALFAIFAYFIATTVTMNTK